MTKTGQTPDRSPNRNRNEAVAQLRQARMKLIAAGKEDKATAVLGEIKAVEALDVSID